MWLLASITAWIAFYFALIAAIFILLRRSYGYFGRRGREAPPMERVRPAQHADHVAELTRQEVNLHETARELSARLDSKIGILEYLTANAQQQIERLESLLQEAGRIATPGEEVAPVASNCPLDASPENDAPADQNTAH